MKSRLTRLSLVLAASALLAQDVRELALDHHPFRVYSPFWSNLHHLLYAAAWAQRPPGPTPSAAGALPEPLTAGLTANERAAWEAAVSRICY